MEEAEKREKAWIGDAVLALWAREWILKNPEIKRENRADIFIKMTSNRFLATLGEPTGEEAKIGVIYQNEGLEAAHHYLDEILLPRFLKQWANERKGNKGRKS